MKKYALNELLEIKNGKDHKNLSKGNIPVYGSGGLMRYANRAIYKKESILLPRKGSLNNIQYSKVPFWTVDTLYYTVINEELANGFYLYNYIKQLDLSKLNTGTGVPSMTFDSYYNIKVNLPPLEEQKSIASVLEAIDNKITLNDQINDNLPN
jgi:type I restriction enzyme, S subunit